MVHCPFQPPFQTAITPTLARLTGVEFFDRAHGATGAAPSRNAHSRRVWNRSCEAAHRSDLPGAAKNSGAPEAFSVPRRATHICPRCLTEWIRALILLLAAPGRLGWTLLSNRLLLLESLLLAFC